jgi:hypothetical protein
MGSLVEIRRTWDLGEALCIKSFLDSRGIYSLIQNEHHITMTGGCLSIALGGFRIAVAIEDAKECGALLAAADASACSLGDEFDEDTVSLSLW